MKLPTALLDWYHVSARDLPWRMGPVERAAGKRPDPYRVWLAEIMLQQTTVPHGARYFLEFTKRWPSVQDLASAADEDVIATEILKPGLPAAIVGAGNLPLTVATGVGDVAYFESYTKIRNTVNLHILYK